MEMSEEPAPFKKFHADVLKLIEVLVAIDPPADSPEGRMLDNLARATEEYEKAVIEAKKGR